MLCFLRPQPFAKDLCERWKTHYHAQDPCNDDDPWPAVVCADDNGFGSHERPDWQIDHRIWGSNAVLASVHKTVAGNISFWRVCDVGMVIPSTTQGYLPTRRLWHRCQRQPARWYLWTVSKWFLVHGSKGSPISTIGSGKSTCVGAIHWLDKFDERKVVVKDDEGMMIVTNAGLEGVFGIFF